MPTPSLEELKRKLAQFFATHSTDQILDTPALPEDKTEPDTWMGGFGKGLYNEFIRPMTSIAGATTLLPMGEEGAAAGLGEKAGAKLSKAEFASKLLKGELPDHIMNVLTDETGELKLPATAQPVERRAEQKSFVGPDKRVPEVTDTRMQELMAKFGGLLKDEKGEVSLRPLAELVKVVKGEPTLSAPAMKKMEKAVRAGEGTEMNWEALSKYVEAFGGDPAEVQKFARMWGATSPNTPVARNNYEALRATKMAQEGTVPFTRANTLSNDITMVNSKYPNLNRANEGLPLSSRQGAPGKTEAMSRLVAGLPDTHETPAIPLDVQALSGIGAAEDNITDAVPAMRNIMSKLYNKSARSFGYEEVYNFAADLYRKGLKELGADFPGFWEGTKKLKGQGESVGIVPWLQRWGLLEPGQMKNPEALDHAIEHVDRSEFFGKQGAESVSVAGKVSGRKAISDIVEQSSKVDEKGQAGTTYNLYKGSLAGTPHYAVAAYPERSVTIEGAPDQKSVATFISKNKDLLDDPEHSVGTWYDRTAGNFVMDVVKTLTDKNEAMQFGSFMDQKAIFDLQNMEDIWLNHNPQDVAAKYAKEKGFPPPTPHVPVKADPEFGKKVADAYEAMAHTPDNPAVKNAYNQLAKELKDQFKTITGAGLKVEPWKQDGQPYADSKSMMTDIQKGHLYYFPTEQGFGESAQSTHPLLEKDPETGLLYNDMLRAVHDYLAHGVGGHQFGPSGEENAFLKHIKLLSPEAAKALATETRGQNSWVNFGSHLRDPQGNIPAKGQPGFIPPGKRPFADQKAGLLPEDLIQEIKEMLAKRPR